MRVPRVAHVRRRLRDQQLRTATLAGVATVPLTVLVSLETMPGWIAANTGVPFVLAALLVGYHYSGRDVSSTRAGFRFGSIAAVGPIIVGLRELYLQLQQPSTDPPVWFLLLAPVVLVVSVALFSLFGAGCVALGETITTRLSAGVAENSSNAG